MGNAAADQTYREVMTIDPSPATTPLEQASREFVFGVWRRPGLSRRDRRWVTLTCVAAADAPVPMEAHAGLDRRDRRIITVSCVAKGEALGATAEAAWATRPGQ